MRENNHTTYFYRCSLKLFFTIGFMLIFSGLYAQWQGAAATPEGVLDKVFDQRGVAYNLPELMIDKDGSSGRPITVLLNCNTNSIFNLYFETGSGMEDVNNATHNARRAVVCKLFQDLSDFLTPPGAPLQPSSATKINIWVRNINNVLSNPAGVLGLASSFYCVPSSTTTGGIVDGEIWKTIHTGADSYLNLSVPLTPLGGSTNQSGLFYHGMVTFNFSDPSVWNTNLSATSIPTTQFDLYTVGLHEVVHSLGFLSLIDANGNSKLGPNYRFFSRYDSFLKSNGISLLTNPACSMYNNVFNTAAGLTTNVLHPTGACTTDVTSCTNAINFAGTVSVPVYRPNCFEDISSLSHFEDMNFPTCNTTTPPYGDDNYFLMCNAGNSGTLRRYLKLEERSALCDIGYAVKGAYGVSGTYINGTATSYNYGVGACGGITVAGVNDGINNTGSYTFSANSGVNYSLSCSTILANDVGATGGFTCLQDLTATPSFPTTLSATSGTSASGPITFNSSLPGLHLLRYVPVSSTGTKGNITYIYLYVLPNVPGCTTTPSSCNLVNNGGFENNNVNITQEGDFYFNKVCDWSGLGFIRTYFIQNPSTPQFSVPCNNYGFENDAIAGHNAYAGILCYSYTNGSTTSGILATQLTTTLSPSTTYQIKFDVSTAEFFKYKYYQLQAFVSSLSPNNITGSIIPNTQLSTGVLVSSPVITNANGWTTVTLTFTTSSTQNNLKYLYLGVLNQPQTSTGTLPQVVANCTNNFNFSPQNGAFYYIDNVSLVATGGAVLDLPASLCSNQSLTNLTAYLSGVTTTGSFSGPGVVLTNGVYSFNPQLAGVGTSTITYSYNSSAGCPMTITDIVTVSNASIGTPIFNFPTTICKNTTPPTLPPTSNNGYAGIWSPATVSNTLSGTYTFTPAFGQCAKQVNIFVTVNNPPVISTITPTTQTVCLNATPINLQVTVNGTGLTYQWYSNTTNSNVGGTMIAGATNSVYVPAVNTVGTRYYYVVISSVAGCVTTSSVLTVIVTTGSASAGTLSGLQTLCKLGRTSPTTVFTASVPGGTWSVSNTSLASIVSTTASPPTATIRMAPGTATVTYTVVGGNGCSASVTRTITTIIPTTPEFLQFPINIENGVPDPTVVCYGGAVPLLPTTSSNGITGTWDVPTISNTASAYYIFTPTSGQCASGFGQQVYVVNSNDFVTNMDFFSVPYAVSTSFTPTVFTNDTYIGQTMDYVPFGLNYTVSLVGTPPTFPVGGMTLNPDGTFTVQPNTTPGSYVFSYIITTSCSVSNVSTVTVRIRNYADHPGKVNFDFCYNPSSNLYTSTSSLSGFTSLLDMATVGNLPATSNNSVITLLSSVPAGFTVNTNGVFTATSALPTFFSFYYRICAATNGLCSDPIIASVRIRSTLSVGTDSPVFYTNGNGPTSYNVIDNDYKNLCPSGTIPANTSNVTISQLAPFNSYFSINSSGVINANASAPAGNYNMVYQICDMSYPTICATGTVNLIQSSFPLRAKGPEFGMSDLKITPNPSKGNFEMIFNQDLPNSTEYSVYDMLGKKIIFDVIQKGNNKGSLNLESFAKGIYLLKLNLNGQVITKTLIKD